MSQSHAFGDFDVSDLRRKLNFCKQENLEMLTKYNEELTELESQVARLRSQVEKSEVHRQSLEYDLAVSRKDASMERCTFEEALAKAKTDQELLLAHNAALQQKLSDVEDDHRHTQHHWEEKRQQLEHDLEQQEIIIKRCCTENELLISEKNKLDQSLQFQIKELQNNLRTELDSRAETLSNLDKCRKQLQDVEIACEKEKQRMLDIIRNLEQGQAESSASLDIMRGAILDKDQVIAELLKVQHEDENALENFKSNIARVTDRNTHLEDQCLHFQKELQSLVDNFYITGYIRRFPMCEASSKAGMQVETLRELLTAYKDQMAFLNRELALIKDNSVKQEKEMATAQEAKSFLGGKLQDTNARLANVSRELDEVRISYASTKSASEDLQLKLQNANQAIETEKQLAKEYERQVESIKASMKTDTEEKKKYFYTIYQQLVQGVVLQRKTDVLLGSFTFEELYAAIEEQIDYLLEELQVEKQKASKHERMFTEKSDAMHHLELANAETLKRMNEEMRDHETDCKKQKEDVEQRFSALLNKSQSKTKKCQEILEKTTQKVLVLEKVQNQLSLENSKLNQQLANQKRDNASLLLACSLMAGALYPLYCRACALTVQRDLLQRQMATYDVAKEDIRALTKIFSKAEERRRDSKTKKKSAKSLIHIFRKAVIVVMASNRLVSLGQSSNSLFTWIDGCREGTGILVCAGFHRRSPEQQNEQRRLNELIKWFKSPDLCSTVIGSIADLQQILNTADPSSRSSGHLIVNAARSSFTKLMDSLRAQMTNLPVSRNILRPSHDKGSLAHNLARGLHKANAKAQSRGLRIQKSILVNVADLQKQIVEFTQKLKACEEDRQSSQEELKLYKRNVAEIMKKAEEV